MARHYFCRMTYGPTFSFAIYFTSAHRHRRCGVGCCGCCRGENHLRMSAPPVRCRLLALEYKPRSGSPARHQRRHDFQPPNSGHTCLIWGALCCSIQPQIIFHDHKRSNHFCTHHLFVGFLVQLPSIISASGASCVPRTRVLGLESTDHAGPHCTCALCVSAARQLTTAVPPSHIICAARTASSLRVDIRAD